MKASYNDCSYEETGITQGALVWRVLVRARHNAVCQRLVQFHDESSPPKFFFIDLLLKTSCQ